MKHPEEHMSKSSGTESEQDWAQIRTLQEAVLLLLSENGSMKWIDVYLHFNENGDGSGWIGPALGLLARAKHIAVEFDGTTKITAAGRERLLYGK